MVELVVPPGALSAPAMITVEEATDLSGVPGVLAAVDIKPDGLTFALPATLTIQLAPSTVPPGFSAWDAALAVPGLQDWMLLPSTYEVDADAVSAPITHLSIHALLVTKMFMPAGVVALLATSPGLEDPAPLPLERMLRCTDCSPSCRFGPVPLGVAVSGDTAVVKCGAYHIPPEGGVRTRSVWTQVYRNVSGVWVLEDVLGPVSLEVDNRRTTLSFWIGGVDISGDTIAMGFPAGGDHGYASGEIRIYVRAGGVWSEQARLTDPNSVGDRVFDYRLHQLSEFGRCLSLSEDWLVAGRKTLPDQHPHSPAALVFQRTGGEWSLQHEITTPSHVNAYDETKIIWHPEVAIHGDTIVIGTPESDREDEAKNVGNAYVYVLDPAPSTPPVRLQESLTPQTKVEEGANFGATVAVYGDTVAVSAPGAWISGPHGYCDGPNGGRVYVFARDGETWFEEAVLYPAGADRCADLFRLALAEATLMVGDPIYDHSGVGTLTHRLGRATRYRRLEGGWTVDGLYQEVYPKGFGVGVAVDGSSLLVMTFWHRPLGGGRSPGAAYFYDIPPITLEGALRAPFIR
jgi:hypothetical protein